MVDFHKSYIIFFWTYHYDPLVQNKFLLISELACSAVYTCSSNLNIKLSTRWSGNMLMKILKEAFGESWVWLWLQTLCYTCTPWPQESYEHIISLLWIYFLLLFVNYVTNSLLLCFCVCVYYQMFKCLLCFHAKFFKYFNKLPKETCLRKWKM